MDEGSICHWWITGKALLEDEVAARILDRYESRQLQNRFLGGE